MVSSISGSYAAQSTILQSLQNKYSASDKDEDGVLSLAEFTEGGPQGVSATQQEALFNNLDADGDGSLTEEEFTSGLAEKTSRPPPPPPLSGDTAQQLASLFQEVDSDDDSVLSLDEFIKGAQERGVVEDEDTLEKVFTALDADEDGSVSEDEFAAGVSKSAEGAGGPPAGGPPPGGPPPGGAPPSQSSSVSEEDEDLISEILSSYLDATEEADEEEKSTALNDAVESLLTVFDQDEDGNVSNEEAFSGLQALRKASFDYLISLQGEDEQVAA